LNILRDQADQHGTRRTSARIHKLERKPDGSFLAAWQAGQAMAAVLHEQQSKFVRACHIPEASIGMGKASTFP
jgi:hypothetical protein